MAKEGSTVSGLMDTFATAISLALQYGVPLRDLVNKFAHVRFEPSGFTGNSEIPIAKSSDGLHLPLAREPLPRRRRPVGARDPGPTALSWPPRSASASRPRPTRREAEEGPIAIDEAKEPPAPKATAVATATASPASEASPPATGRSDSATASGKLDLPVVEPAKNGHNGNGHANGNGNGNGRRGRASSAIAASLGAERTAFKIQEDAPSCMECGSIMVRNGSCYKCLNCGATSGCS